MNIFNIFLNLIFPPTCGFCNTLNSNFLCVNCLLKINSIKQSNIDNYELSDFYFNEHFYLFKYENDIRKFIINYKFNEHSYLYKTFSQIFKYDTVFNEFISNYDCVLSVPIHKKRLHTRGYNQSKLIAKDFCSFFNIPYYDDVLIKTSNIVAQSSLDKENRKSNILNAFSVYNVEKIINKRVLIFDDIFTTGATLNECSRILLNNNVKYVGVASLAKD